jgi:hypothetical protein
MYPLTFNIMHLYLIYEEEEEKKIPYGKTMPDKVAKDSMKNLLKLKLVTSL